MKKLTIDLNSDVGESFGPYRMGNDEELFPYITSANIACGFHAGDPSTMMRTLELAAQHHVSVGAHPGYADMLHFGRTPLPYSPSEVVDFVLYQVGALQLMAESAGLKLQHLKLHGALYHVASSDPQIAEMLLDAMVRLKTQLIIVGPAGSVLQREAGDRGLDFAVEGFADRGYLDNGKLAPRGTQGSLIENPEQAADQALQLAREHKATTISGSKIDLKIDTLCIHGDTPGAPAIAKHVREKLEAAKIAVEPIHRILE